MVSFDAVVGGGDCDDDDVDEDEDVEDDDRKDTHTNTCKETHIYAHNRLNKYT